MPEGKDRINGKELGTQAVLPFLDNRLRKMVLSAASPKENDQASPEEITAIKTENAKLAQRLESLRAMFNGVFDEMNHDVNGAVATAVAFLQLDCPTEMTDVVMAKLMILSAAIKSGRNTLGVENGEFQLEAQPINLIETLKWIEKGTKTNNRKIKVLVSEKKLSPDQYEILGDRNLIIRIFLNLIKNAFEATEKTEKRDPVVIEIDSTETHHLISITNQGTIPEEIRSCFFERGVTSGKNNGKGLGTYIAKTFIEAHGGEISFEVNEKANTTTITVKLPKDPLAALAEKAAQQPAEPRNLP